MRHEPVKENKLRLEEPKTDYQRAFQPFHLKQHTILPFVKYQDPRMEEEIDIILASARESEVTPCLPKRKPKRRNYRHYLLNETCASLMKNLAEADTSESQGHIIASINRLPRKHIQFAEHVRPPYRGTFTKQSILLRRRNPFRRDPALFMYDYDSEAEWVESEGEDLCAESLDGEDEDEDEGDGSSSDCESFVENMHDQPQKRKVLAPLSVNISALYDDESTDNRKYAAELFPTDACMGLSFPLDPYHDYWSVNKQQSIAAISTMTASTGVSSINAEPSQFNVKFPQSFIPPFLQYVDGNTEHKVLLVELLKKRCVTS